MPLDHENRFIYVHLEKAEVKPLERMFIGGPDDYRPPNGGWRNRRPPVTARTPTHPTPRAPRGPR